jgi:glycosyltransferase involved in cell wall biosynthesis
VKILLICHEYPPIGGGSATVASGLARALAAEHDVTVLTTGYGALPAEERQGAVTVRRVRTLRRTAYGATPIELLAFTLAAVWLGARLCRTSRFDACVAIQGIPAAWVAWPLGWLFKMPYLVALVGADVPGFLPERFDRLHRVVAPLTRRTWRRAAAVAANSDSLRTLAERTARPLGITVETILYGVDTDVHRPPDGGREAWPVRFLFVGRLSTQKGPGYLVDAVARAHERLQGRAIVVMVGDGEEREALEARVRAERLDDVISFRGWLSREDLARGYREASVFVLPSLDEGRSQAALEAMACGLAVVATAIEGNAGLVEAGVNGFVVPPRDAAALADALATVVDLGPAKLVAMGDASRARVVASSWRDVAASYVRRLEAAR